MKLISEEVVSTEYIVEEKNGKKDYKNPCLLTI